MMLSDSNQALVHITDETTLMDEICRIAVEVGGYRLAWIGFAEQDEAKTLRPVAHAGYESGYLMSANSTWADSERGRGPDGTAIRTGQPSMARNISVNPAFAPWRAEAILRGYQSVIALPLTREGRTFGALGIYASEVDAFDTKEVEILNELANDLAFGITALRTQAKRDQAENALIASEERYRNLFLTMAQGVVYQDSTGSITNANPAAEQILGLSLDQMQGRTSLDPRWKAVHEDGTLFPGDQHPSIVAQKSGKPVTGVVMGVFNPRDTAYRWILIDATPQILPGETVSSRVYTTFMDITEQKMAQDALNRATKKLSFLNSITFSDIQNALYSLSGYLALEKRVPMDEKLQEYLGKEIVLVQAITESLKFARIYQNLGITPPAWQSVKQSFLFGISHLDISKLSRKLNVEGLEIYADPLLENVFFTLAENVVLHGKTATEIALSYYESPEGLTIFFEDNGVGIQDDTKEKIFDRRYEGKKGMGLFLGT